MPYWLARHEDRLAEDWIKRFDPRFWTVNFPRPAMGSVVTTGPDSLRVDCVFYQRQDLAGLIWESEDRWDHPLLAYETARDYRGMTLSFRWRTSGAIAPLSAVYGATLTIEGRDQRGAPRTWYVRLWNYATGSAADARITLDFDRLAGGFMLPEEADPVWAGDIDRMFFSIVPETYDGGSGVLTPPAEGTVMLSEIRCEGSGASIGLGDAFVPPHRLRIATGYDDLYHMTPERVLHNIVALGYRDWINHYVGMSHYFRLARDAASGRFVAQGAGSSVLNAAARQWHADFYARSHTFGFRVITSLSFELLDEHAPEAWKQRDHEGAPALTGWDPPSTLLSPCNGAAVDYLKAVARDFCALAAASGLPVDFQIGEPWWWSGLGGVRRPCFYDAATTAAYTAETGRAVPTRHRSVTENPDAAQAHYLDWLGQKLGAATLALRDAVKAAHPGARVALLFFTPQVIDAGAPMLARVNMPGAWAFPAFDLLQVEDYDHVTAENWGAHERGIAVVDARFGYPRAAQHYFAGFVLDGADRAQWRAIGRSIGDARDKGYGEVFVWALPQTLRDGFAFFDTAQEDEMDGFHDVRFPLEVGMGASGGPEFSTTVIATASGFEQRNMNWAQARARYDAGLGVRSETDLATVIAFFRARRGRACGFRFRDPFDYGSNAAGDGATPFDQVLGTGDGVRTGFPLVKRYGGEDGHTRRITRPVAETVRVAVNGVERRDGWALGAAGEVRFAEAPAPGAVVTAGFLFDVPVRFADDHLAVSLAGFRAGEIPSIPLVEVREA
ncbi:phage distal tail protein, Rcc01695 family [Pedomonas sp. V897]|uniref:phage distal tail protein, Rcc01695 family n=1 Tax=Pedomonas sp. V897 TaxID=3446482 RepID=UPI003EDFAA54